MRVHLIPDVQQNPVCDLIHQVHPELNKQNIDNAEHQDHRRDGQKSGNVFLCHMHIDRIFDQKRADQTDPDRNGQRDQHRNDLGDMRPQVVQNSYIDFSFIAACDLFVFPKGISAHYALTSIPCSGPYWAR